MQYLWGSLRTVADPQCKHVLCRSPWLPRLLRRLTANAALVALAARDVANQITGLHYHGFVQAQHVADGQRTVTAAHIHFAALVHRHTAAALGRHAHAQQEGLQARPVDDAQGVVAAQRYQRRHGCVGGRQVRQLVGPAAKAAFRVLAGSKKSDDVGA